MKIYFGLLYCFSLVGTDLVGIEIPEKLGYDKFTCHNISDRCNHSIEMDDKEPGVIRKNGSNHVAEHSAKVDVTDVKSSVKNHVIEMVENDHVISTGLKFMLNMQGINLVEFSGEKQSEDNIDYEELSKIIKKYIAKRDYTAEEVKELKRMPLSQTKLSDADFKKLSSLKGVLLWNLGRCHALTRDSIPVIKSLNSARAIDLADTKLFKDYDEIVDTFKDFKNLEFLSVHLLDQEPTEKFKEFLKERPNLKAFVGSYKIYRLEHKEALHAALDRWLEEGLIKSLKE